MWWVLCSFLAGCAGSVCEYDGETYDVGESFPSSDGCNTCSCERGGDVACTRLSCET
ncbi:MAG: hypothetical protein ABMA64_05430 [Myxococcota bacterium]